MHEVAEALATSHAVARLHGKTTSFVGGVVASVSTPRLLCFLAMQLFRLAVAVLLGYGGAFFIGHTIKLSDLILSCIALEVRSSLPPASSLFSCLRALFGVRDPLYGLACLLGWWPCAALVPQPRLHRAGPRCTPVMRRTRAV